MVSRLQHVGAMRSYVILAVLVVAGVWGIVEHVPERAAAADPAPPTGPRLLRSVAIDGHGLPLVALREVIATRVGEPADPARLEHDRAALADALHARGYLAAKVAPARVSGDVTGAYVTFAIAQGKLYRVRSVVVTGASAREAGVVTLAAGDTALPDRIERAREALADRLAARGKKLNVELELATDDAAAAVDVSLVAR
jgi:hypothetical protein